MSPVDLMRASFDAAVAAADPLRIVARAFAATAPWPRDGRGGGQGRRQHGARGRACLARRLARRAGDHALRTRRTDASAFVSSKQDIRCLTMRAKLRRATSCSSFHGLQPDDLLLALISGGGSSLLSLPVPEVSMASLKSVTTHVACQRCADRRDEHRAQASVANRGRARLAAAAAKRGARVLALMISDVTGDAPTDIASGPCAPDPSTYADAISGPLALECPCTGRRDGVAATRCRWRVDETPKPGDPLFGQVESRVIATAHDSLEAAAEVFRSAGIQPIVLGDTVTGEAREVAKVYAALVREIRVPTTVHSRPPVALISGGECTVTLPAGASGGGGRCTEFLLSLAVELNGMPGVYALACDTDGIDGSENNAGAWLAPGSRRGSCRTWSCRRRNALDRCDAYGFFRAADSLIVTGPTRTNVNDYRVILIQ